MDIRERIREGLQLHQTSILEIGPLCRPFVKKSEADVTYVDHADTDTLRQKYRTGHDFNPYDIVEVDSVWGQQSLLECLHGKLVDYAIASHVIEHVPDLITWLSELSAVLKAHGEIRLVVPDKRFTFDYTRRLTEMPEVIEAYLRRTRRPLPWNILDHILNVRRVDTAAAWLGPLSLDEMPLSHPFEMAIGVAKDAIDTENYHDVHCWVFTPKSFAQLMQSLVEHDLLKLACRDFGDTPHGSLEFTAFLYQTKDKDVAIESWKAAGDAVSHKSAALTEEHWERALVAISSLLRGYEIENSSVTIIEQQMKKKSDELEDLRGKLNCAKIEMDRFRSSNSWKITAPLRKIATSARRIYRKDN